MNKIPLLCAIALLLITSALAQDIESERRFRELAEKQRRESVALEAIFNIAPNAKALQEQANGNAVNFIAEAAKSGDKALLPHLKVLAADKEARVRKGSAAYEAHIALAKLGDAEVLPEVFNELEVEDPSVQSTAIAKLVQIGGKEAYRKLYQLLDDLGKPATNQDKSACDVVHIPTAWVVINHLRESVSNPPRDAKGSLDHYDTSLWKAWFEKNKHLIE